MFNVSYALWGRGNLTDYPTIFQFFKNTYLCHTLNHIHVKIPSDFITIKICIKKQFYLLLWFYYVQYNRLSLKYMFSHLSIKITYNFFILHSFLVVVVFFILVYFTLGLFQNKCNISDRVHCESLLSNNFPYNTEPFKVEFLV